MASMVRLDPWTVTCPAYLLHTRLKKGDVTLNHGALVYVDYLV